MRKQSFVLACSVALSLLGTGAARSENLLEVYQAAVKNDPVIREADARRMAALEVKPQARALLLPQVNVNGQVYTGNFDSESTFPAGGRDHGAAVSRSATRTRRTSKQYWTYSAELIQTVFRWDQWQKLKRADSEVAIAEANYRAAQQDLLVRVSQAYFDVLAAEDTLAAAEATVQAFNRQLEQSEKRFEVGLIAITDVQESRAAHDSATAELIAAKRALASTNEALREIAGDTYATLVKPADDMPLNQPDPLDEQQWVTKALDENLSVIAARLDSEVAASNVKIARSGHMPTVDLFAQYSARPIAMRPRSTRCPTRRANSASTPARCLAGGLQQQQRRHRPARKHPDVQRRRDAFESPGAGVPAARGPRETRGHDALGRAADA